MTKAELIRAFDLTTEELYRVFTMPGIEQGNIQLPYGKITTAAIFIHRIFLHDSGHEFMTVDHADDLGTGRPPEVSQDWG